MGYYIHTMHALTFLTKSEVRKISLKYGTPVFVYDKKTLQRQAAEFLAFPNAYGLIVRYAMKANPLPAILKIFDKSGLYIDASSGYEVERAIKSGIQPKKIMLTTQEVPDNLNELVEHGIYFNACSLYQLERFGELFSGGELSIRINPGLGSGGTHRTNVGGPAASFGIWYEYIEDIFRIAKKYKLHIKKIHTHIGSGSDPEIWQKVASMSLHYVELFPEVETLNLGGGFKVDRMNDSKTVNLQKVGGVVKHSFEEFYKKTGRKIHLEVEPGTFLIAKGGSLITKVRDIVSTGKSGFNFLKVDAGMHTILRPSLYGAQHPLVIVGTKETSSYKDYVVVGNCCESGDILTPKDGEPEEIGVRRLQEASTRDLLVIEWVGAYCSAMNVKNYNSFPSPTEVMLETDGTVSVIKNRQSLEQMTENEV